MKNLDEDDMPIYPRPYMETNPLLMTLPEFARLQLRTLRESQLDKDEKAERIQGAINEVADSPDGTK